MRLLKALEPRRAVEVARCFSQCRSPLRMLRAYALRSETEWPLEMELRDGTHVRLFEYGDLTTAWYLFFRGEYPLPEECRHVLDLGANIGCFSLDVCRRRPQAQVFAVEAYPPTFAQLEENIALNNLQGRIRVLSAAAGASPGTVRMGADHLSSNAQSIVFHRSAGSGYEVETYPLEELMNTSGFHEVDLLKMDIEGAETDVLKTASTDVLRRCGMIAYEWHGETSERVCANAMQKAQFRQTLRRSNGWSGIAAWKRA